MNSMVKITKEDNSDNIYMNWSRKLYTILIECSIILLLITPSIVYGIFPIPAIYYVSPDEAIDEVINANISSYSNVKLTFFNNVINKVEGHESNYKVISNKKLTDHGSIIELSCNHKYSQGFKMSFTDNKGKVFDVNFTSSFLGANLIIISNLNPLKYSPTRMFFGGYVPILRR